MWCFLPKQRGVEKWSAGLRRLELVDVAGPCRCVLDVSWCACPSTKVTSTFIRLCCMVGFNGSSAVDVVSLRPSSRSVRCAVSFHSALSACLIFRHEQSWELISVWVCCPDFCFMTTDLKNFPNPLFWNKCRKIILEIAERVMKIKGGHITHELQVLSRLYNVRTRGYRWRLRSMVTDIVTVLLN